MRKKEFLKICLLIFLAFAGLMDLGLLVVIGIYEAQFFWMYLLLTGIFYTLGIIGTIKEKYSLLYMFAGYIIIYRCTDIALRTMNVIKTDHSTKYHVAVTSRPKRDVLIEKDGKCCLFGSESAVEYLIPSCCHDYPNLRDPVSKACQLAGYGNFAYRCEERRGRKTNPEIDESEKIKGISLFAVVYCVRTTVDVVLLFFVFLLAYMLQYKK